MAEGDRYVKGAPYSARFYQTENAHANASIGIAYIQPPFVMGDTDLWIEGAMEVEGGTKIEVNHLLSTQLTTALEIVVKNEGDSDELHDDRMEVAFEGLGRLVEMLNEVDNNTHREG